MRGTNPLRGLASLTGAATVKWGKGRRFAVARQQMSLLVVSSRGGDGGAGWCGRRWQLGPLQGGAAGRSAACVRSLCSRTADVAPSLSEFGWASQSPHEANAEVAKAACASKATRMESEKTRDMGSSKTVE